MANTLDEARHIINAADTQMAELFVQRMRAVEMVWEYKKEHGLPVLDAARENEILAGRASAIEEPVLQAYYLDILRELLKISRAYQYRLQNDYRVACGGGIDTPVYLAVKAIFPYCVPVLYGNNAAACASVESGECDTAVLLLQNGAYVEEQTINLLYTGNLFINGIYPVEARQDCLNDRPAGDISIRAAVLARQRACTDSLSGTVLLLAGKCAEEMRQKADSILNAFGYRVLMRQSCTLTALPQSCLYLELEGSLDTKEGQEMLRKLGTVCDTWKVIGGFAPQKK